MGAPTELARPFLDVLYSDLLERGIQHFLPSVQLTAVGAAATHTPVVQFEKTANGLMLDWLGVRYALAPGKPLSENERKLLKSVSRVLSSRYRFLIDRELASRALELFRGVPEDRYVSAFLDPAPYKDVESRLNTADRVADAIDVLRTCALTTYENRRIVTGVLVFGAQPDPCHIAPPKPAGALPYSMALTSIRSFHRLCDGLQTLALVNEEGLLVELVDVQRWTEPYSGFDLPVPPASRYESHCRATLCGGHTSLVLTPNGEIKVFADGAQVFNFIDGHWRLTDPLDKYRRWVEAIANEKLAEKLYRVAVNLAEERRGGLFVILDDADTAAGLIAPGDLLDREQPPFTGAARSKDQLHYLLRETRLVDLPATVIESIARIDGGIVMDRDSRLRAFGAILRLGLPAETPEGMAEGGRTTAAIGASRFGKVLKVSEDGGVSFYRDGHCVWEM